MDKEIKAKWVEALRSGDYTQGSQMLRSEDNKFCCLGVLCDIVDNTKWKKISYRYSYDENNSIYLSNDFLINVDLDQKTMKKLSKYNDVGGSFSEIADWIEENL